MTLDILLIEDNPGDVRLIRDSLSEAGIDHRLHSVYRGDEGLEYLTDHATDEDKPLPNLVLLDLNLPGLSGMEVLREIRSTPELEPIPVLILTSSRAEEEIVEAYREGANAYLTKPISLDELTELAESVAGFWSEVAELPPEDE